MKAGIKLPVIILMLAAPVAAHAQIGAPHILLYSFGGGFGGGLIGALLACWLCKRFFGSKDHSDSKR